MGMKEDVERAQRIKGDRDAKWRASEAQRVAASPPPPPLRMTCPRCVRSVPSSGWPMGIILYHTLDHDLTESDLGDKLKGRELRQSLRSGHGLYRWEVTHSRGEVCPGVGESFDDSQ